MLEMALTKRITTWIAPFATLSFSSIIHRAVDAGYHPFAVPFFSLDEDPDSECVHCAFLDWHQAMLEAAPDDTCLIIDERDLPDENAPAHPGCRASYDQFLASLQHTTGRNHP